MGKKGIRGVMSVCMRKGEGNEERVGKKAVRKQE